MYPVYETSFLEVFYFTTFFFSFFILILLGVQVEKLGYNKKLDL